MNSTPIDNITLTELAKSYRKHMPNWDFLLTPTEKKLAYKRFEFKTQLLVDHDQFINALFQSLSLDNEIIERISKEASNFSQIQVDELQKVLFKEGENLLDIGDKSPIELLALVKRKLRAWARFLGKENALLSYLNCESRSNPLLFTIEHLI